MASRLLNGDIETKILSHLPVECLFRFRSACKLWRDVIDSPSFRKSQITNYKNDSSDDAAIVLCKRYQDVVDSWESSIIFRDTAKSYDFPALGELINSRYLVMNPLSRFRFVGPVSGLICIHGVAPYRDIAVCNPCLDQIKILPDHPICSHADSLHVGISYDSIVDDYKVVRLQSCTMHGHLHASIYSKKMNSWRDLASSGEHLSVDIDEPILSLCRNGTVAHWRARKLLGGEGLEDIILSFDMKTEVFRSLEMPGFERLRYRGIVKIYEKGGTFVLIISDYRELLVYEGRFEGNDRVVWYHLKRVGVVGALYDILGRSGSEALLKLYQSPQELIVYDYSAEKTEWRIELPIDSLGVEVFNYDLSFVSP